ncbi:RNA polymerase factor sigma-70 [Lysinibacillus sp. BF-4]|uniref:RNA polymerase sporulation sigma factor SigH n=1 Tax=Lysinibacillus sp. BF-4 TaxID=1473546 RepID=UPI0005017AC0|nr:RNA polymerase sporulation sigma factor SigH [Lysinibacillus sp. BF-4]KFL43877.1 RNA polymerase factor sigma-70 [Lysinibacillus sp. BF-4]
MNKFELLADEEVINLIQQGDVEALEYIINKYKIIVLAKAKSYFLIGADREDIIQEGMIGLYKAIRDYRDDKNASFRVFAELCVTRQIITAIKTATRQKHMPLNAYVSLDKPVYEEDSEKTLVETMVGPTTIEPENIVLQQEQQDYIELKMSEVLSELEQRVLALYLEGQSYGEISEQLDRHVKSIDNALQRVKRKLGQHIEVTEILG